MTEDEAKTKWCPMDDFNRRCMASGCMMWRQRQAPNPGWKPSGGLSFPMQDTRFDQPMYIDDPDHGYCGLAGRL